MNRFIVVQEPTCTWAVLDAVDNVPAEFGDVVLIGLGKAEAVKLASLANAEQTLRIGEGRIAGTGLRLVVARAA
jgi:hypothetical protein